MSFVIDVIYVLFMWIIADFSLFFLVLDVVNAKSIDGSFDPFYVGDMTY